jgi:hypothetical protein
VGDRQHEQRQHRRRRIGDSDGRRRERSQPVPEQKDGVRPCHGAAAPADGQVVDGAMRETQQPRDDQDDRTGSDGDPR